MRVVHVFSNQDRADQAERHFRYENRKVVAPSKRGYAQLPNGDEIYWMSIWSNPAGQQFDEIHYHNIWLSQDDRNFMAITTQTQNFRLRVHPYGKVYYE